MTLSFAIAIFVISWWIVLLAILPLKMGAKPAPPGLDPFAEAAGAPSSSKIKLKFIVTTIIAAVIASALYGAFHSGLLTPFIRPAVTSK
jgi:predicted secreted protein